ncbi:MAG TPA: beta-ketoacyl-[acyl-carrier-protein] synthase II [Elusimicrobia bacterium]|nr:beta-ketoacyl-[acyl-carrier-protein] synthase II [Elusimicrobiota bacterium]
MGDNPCRLAALGMVNCLGTDTRTVWERTLRGDQSGLVLDGEYFPGRQIRVGRIGGGLPEVPEAHARYRCRNNAIALAALRQISEAVRAAVREHGPARVGVVMGSSTSGVAASETAYAAWMRDGALPAGYFYCQNELWGLAQFLADYCGATGPAYAISTACSSSAKVFASARALLETGVCGAVLAGGADSLCQLTVQGFSSLQAVSDQPCNSMSRNRRGFNVGEGAAVFLLTREAGGIQLLGVGESSDAHHMSAPDPEGTGAAASMAAALADAGLAASAVSYLNLHGTGTGLNDRMEGKAVSRVLPGVPASSTKPLTGHTLGAAGAMEVGFCWLALANPADGKVCLPPHCWDGAADETIPPLALTRPGQTLPAAGRVTLMSNSFGFGGSNCSLILGVAK